MPDMMDGLSMNIEQTNLDKLLREDSGMELMEKVCPGGKPI